MERIEHTDLVQGEDNWKAHRRNHKNASEAAAMLGISPHVTRNELVRMYATGDEQEFSDYVQKYVLDRGHEVEALARPFADDLVGDVLYPSTFSLGEYSCSTDGLTMDETTAWECKQHSQALAEALKANVMPPLHMPQCQQICMITGATRCLFTVSDGTPENTLHIWVKADEEWFDKIRAGWKQFDIDVANYQHVEVAPVVVGKAPETLPALRIELTGMVTGSNLVEFESQAMAVIEAISTELTTDEDFANAKATVKWLKGVEEKLAAEKEKALSQTQSIDALFRTMDTIIGESSRVRLNLNKTVTESEKNRKAEIILNGKHLFEAHILSLNLKIGNKYMPEINADFAGVCHGLKTIKSRLNAVDTELARVKIESNAIAVNIIINISTLRDLASDHKGLFPDTGKLVMKENEDLINLVKSRIADHKQEESDRAAELVAKIQAEADKKAADQLEIDRAKIREEEEAKARDKVAAEQTPEPVEVVTEHPPCQNMATGGAPEQAADAVTDSTPKVSNIPGAKQTITMNNDGDIEHTVTRTSQLTDTQPSPNSHVIVNHLMSHYEADMETVIRWLKAIDFDLFDQKKTG